MIQKVGQGVGWARRRRGRWQRQGPRPRPDGAQKKSRRAAAGRSRLGRRCPLHASASFVGEHLLSAPASSQSKAWATMKSGVDPSAKVDAVGQVGVDVRHVPSVVYWRGGCSGRSTLAKARRRGLDPADFESVEAAGASGTLNSAREIEATSQQRAAAVGAPARGRRRGRDAQRAEDVDVEHRGVAGGSRALGSEEAARSSAIPASSMMSATSTRAAWCRGGYVGSAKSCRV